jgi:hypothetical protein
MTTAGLAWIGTTSTGITLIETTVQRDDGDDDGGMLTSPITTTKPTSTTRWQRAPTGQYEPVCPGSERRTCPGGLRGSTNE